MVVALVEVKGSQCQLSSNGRASVAAHAQRLLKALASANHVALRGGVRGDEQQVGGPNLQTNGSAGRPFMPSTLLQCSTAMQHLLAAARLHSGAGTRPASSAP